MKICVLASGSRGNCTYVETNNHKILIDLGTNLSYTTTHLLDLGIDPKDIDSIFITHTHGDHINGIPTFIKKYNPMIYLTEKMYNELSFNLKDYSFIEDERKLDDLLIDIIKLSHDRNDINGYILESNSKTLVYITDTGYINQKNHSRITNKDMYIMESNHDITMLMNCHRPHHTKMRIISDVGHLSNEDSSKYLAKFIGDNTKSVVLAHLSDENNTPELAITTLKNILKEKNKVFDNILIATQDNRLEMIEI
ncbi:MAG: MBL fold metallo-hydrolase [Ignavibacteriales bacterium]